MEQSMSGPSDLEGLLPNSSESPWSTIFQKTCIVIKLHLLVTVFIIVVVIMTALPWSSIAGFDMKCNSIMAIFLYSQSSYLCFTLILYHLYKSKHGFINFAGHISSFKDFDNHIKYFIYIPCIGAAVSLALFGIYSNFYPSMILDCSFTSFKSPIPSIGLLILLQNLAMMYFIIIYLRDIDEFIRSNPWPTIERSDLWPGVEAPNVFDVGYRDHSNNTQNLLERQNDLLQYYRSLLYMMMVVKGDPNLGSLEGNSSP